jgi:hypothetical protein
VQSGGASDIEGQLVEMPAVTSRVTEFATATKFVDWLSPFREVSHDHQTFFAGGFGGSAKAFWSRNNQSNKVEINANLAKSPGVDNGACDKLVISAAIGYFAEPRLEPNTMASCKTYWSPAECTALILTTTSTTCSSASINTRPPSPSANAAALESAFRDQSAAIVTAKSGRLTNDACWLSLTLILAMTTQTRDCAA